jgi:hypothetical protein
VIFYRGIALSPQTADMDIDAIRSTGELAGAKAWWDNSMAMPGLVRARTTELAVSPDKIRGEINHLPQVPLTYACGQFDDAARYAWRARYQNRTMPVVVAFETAIENAIIDGKDFLYTVFQLWDRQSRTHLARVRATLGTLYGSAILPWFDRARRKNETQERIGLCDLAVHDLASVKAHYANLTGIEGRFGTLFRSAFALPATVEPTAILNFAAVVDLPQVPTRTIPLASVLAP